MVNGKVLHLESSPPARIFKLGPRPPRLPSDRTLCAICLVCESWDHVRRSINPALSLHVHHVCSSREGPHRLRPCVGSRAAANPVDFLGYLIHVSRPASLPTHSLVSSRSWEVAFSLSPLFFGAAVARHQQRCAPGQSPSLSSLAAAHH